MCGARTEMPKVDLRNHSLGGLGLVRVYLEAWKSWAKSLALWKGTETQNKWILHRLVSNYSSHGSGLAHHTSDPASCVRLCIPCEADSFANVCDAWSRKDNKKHRKDPMKYETALWRRYCLDPIFLIQSRWWIGFPDSRPWNNVAHPDDLLDYLECERSPAPKWSSSPLAIVYVSARTLPAAEIARRAAATTRAL